MSLADIRSLYAVPSRLAAPAGGRERAARTPLRSRQPRPPTARNVPIGLLLQIHAEPREARSGGGTNDQR
jgi:hypothetical protein